MWHSTRLPLELRDRRNLAFVRTAFSHSIAVDAELRREKLLLHLILNAYWEHLELPPVTNKEPDPWRRWIDTLLSPNDIVEWQTAPSIQGYRYRAEPRSVVALVASLDVR